MKYNFDTVKEYIFSKGCKLLTNEYSSSQHPLDIECPNGHKIRPTFSEFKRKERCNSCSKNKKPTIDQIQQFVNDKQFKVLSKEYTNNNNKLSIKCSNDHVWDITWNNLQQGNGCPYCYGNKKYQIQDIKSYIEQQGYQLNQDFYINVSEKLNLICPNKHSYSVTYHDFLEGVRCGTCFSKTSQAEKEILDFVQQYYPSAAKTKFNKIIPGSDDRKELDIYIPELNLGIEYCGLFWHSDLSGKKETNQHRKKLLLAETNNVRLITIFEDEWLSRKEQVKNLLSSVLNIHKLKIGARKCTIREVVPQIAKSFVNEHHIQPLNSKIKIAYGLYYNEELVGIIVGNMHHRQNHQFVLQRLCFKNQYQIQGGASRLFKQLITYAKANGHKEIVSWSDNRISQGNVYSKLNFRLDREYIQDYSYVLNGECKKRFSKQSLKKTKQEQSLDKTEYELRIEQGYHRIWDCGKKKWVYDCS